MRPVRVLGAAIGVVGQQVSKYERALDRVPASRLYRIAVALNAPIRSFFAQGGEAATVRTRAMVGYWRACRERRKAF